MVQRYLDTIIFLADPLEKRPAHITLRGPYQERSDAARNLCDIERTDINIFGVGRFFGDRQNTVFLRCDSKFIKDNWWKKDFPYNPHITIYDGSSRDLATSLFERLRMHRVFFSVLAGECATEVSAKGQHAFDLMLQVDQEIIRSAAGEDINIQSAGNLPDWRRLMLIDRIFVNLKGYADRLSGCLPKSNIRVAG